MAKHLADVEIHAAESVESLDEDSDDVDVSVDQIDDRLYLGNLACARDAHATTRLGITHILTIDVVPLPRATLARSGLIFKFVKLADVSKEDLISHLPETNDFIQEALDSGGTVLVHCYFGVSRSAAVVIAYVMRLKILPQLFADLVRPDPALARERPDPRVYRCKRCRRIVAGCSNIIPHVPKQLKIELARKGIRPPPSKLTGLDCAESGQVLMDKLRNLAGEIDHMLHLTDSGSDLKDVKTSESAETLEPTELFAEGSEGSLGGAAPRDAPVVCKQMWFVEPMAWMQGVAKDPHGKLHCPKCQTKIGSFSWVMGCKCPCGQKVAPAFYLVPSKVEWSNIVQNVQTTV